MEWISGGCYPETIENGAQYRNVASFGVGGLMKLRQAFWNDWGKSREVGILLCWSCWAIDQAIKNTNYTVGLG